MNERIRELAKQAGFLEEDGGNNLHVFDGYEAITCTEELKKFSELLIEECADIATNRYQRLMDGGKAIKQHFGVKS
jgi:hypothetical protein